VDAAVGGANADAEKTRWLILVYQLPREPSRHRIAAWRKLKALGALYLQDGAAALPEDTVTREQLEWLQLWDEKYVCSESEGLDSIVRRMQLVLPDDEALTHHTDAFYDGLYSYLRREVL
jgi:hypothetical protein